MRLANNMFQALFFCHIIWCKVVWSQNEAKEVDLSQPQNSLGEVAIINLVEFHHEVYPAFHYAWQKAGYEVTTFAKNSDHLFMSSVTSNWGFSVTNITEIGKRFCRFLTIIFTSVEYYDDYKFASRVIKAKCKTPTRNYVFVIHNPGVFRDSRRGVSRMKVLLSQPEIQNAYLIGLGPHIASSLKDWIIDWGHDINIDYMLPIFPLDKLHSHHKNMNFVMQGTIHTRRRNYNSVITELFEKSSSVPNQFRLILLGNGNYTLPVDYSPIISMLQNAAYPEYYEIIEQSIGLLTAFGSKAYLSVKASSTIAASFICHTPLVTESNTLNTYSYISKTSLWIKNEGESDAAALLRIAALPDLEDQYTTRFNSLGRDIEKMLDRNVDIVNKIMNSFKPTPVSKK